MRRMWSALFLSSALLIPISAAPAAAAPAPGAAPKTVVVRVYDPYRHDYHSWNRAEEYRYRRYLRERHYRYVAYRRQREEERRAYWRWRHEREEREEHRR